MVFGGWSLKNEFPNAGPRRPTLVKASSLNAQERSILNLFSQRGPLNRHGGLSA